MRNVLQKRLHSGELFWSSPNIGSSFALIQSKDSTRHLMVLKTSFDAVKYESLLRSDLTTISAGHGNASNTFFGSLSHLTNLRCCCTSKHARPMITVPQDVSTIRFLGLVTLSIVYSRRFTPFCSSRCIALYPDPEISFSIYYLFVSIRGTLYISLVKPRWLQGMRLIALSLIQEDILANAKPTRQKGQGISTINVWKSNVMQEGFDSLQVLAYTGAPRTLFHVVPSSGYFQLSNWLQNTALPRK